MWTSAAGVEVIADYVRYNTPLIQIHFRAKSAERTIKNDLDLDLGCGDPTQDAYILPQVQKTGWKLRKGELYTGFKDLQGAVPLGAFFLFFSKKVLTNQLIGCIMNTEIKKGEQSNVR